MEQAKHLFFVPSQDPTALGRRLAAEAKERPVVTDADLGLPVVLRKSHVTAAFRDTETFTTRMFQAGILNGGLASLQGEAHTRMRKVYNMFFTARAVDRYEEKFAVPIAEQVVSELEGKDRADLLDAFAVEMPKRVISALFGLPLEQLTENDARIRDMFRSIVQIGNPEAAAAGQKAYEEALVQIDEIARKEMASPSDTLLGEIMRVLAAEDMASIENCQQIVLSLLLGGYETTIWLLADALYALLAHPEALARVQKDPSLIPPAVEESMRWCPSNVGTVRLVERPFEMDDLKLAAGSVVYLAMAANHYDDELYPNPAAYDIDRRPTPMIFGGGPHFCVGAPLARMEARVGLGKLLARFPDLRLDTSEKPTFMYGVRGSVAYGPDKLPAFLK
ncbi:MAG: cytochrome P450 [Polyangiaceae bacterium]